VLNNPIDIPWSFMRWHTYYTEEELFCVSSAKWVKGRSGVRGEYLLFEKTNVLNWYLTNHQAGL
jgi:hypothetical protein